MTNQVIPDEAVEAAAKAFQLELVMRKGEIGASSLALLAALEAAAPHMIQAARAEAWDEGHLMGWNEATANTLPERESLWRNPYRTAK
jgi:hypothetical protein